MTNYVWSATDKSGQKVIKEIEAASAEDAKFVLQAQGYLCCTLASQRDVTGAKKCFALAKKYLIATKEDALLAKCRELTGEV